MKYKDIKTFTIFMAIMTAFLFLWYGVFLDINTTIIQTYHNRDVNGWIEDYHISKGDTVRFKYKVKLRP